MDGPSASQFGGAHISIADPPPHERLYMATNRPIMISAAESFLVQSTHDRYRDSNDSIQATWQAGVIADRGQRIFASDAWPIHSVRPFELSFYQLAHETKKYTRSATV